MHVALNAQTTCSLCNTIKPWRVTNLAEVPRLVCQAESLGRLQGAEPYNQVLMDESKSILAQLSSQMTMEDCAGIVTQVLYDVSMKGQKVVFADAYMTSRTLNLVHHIFDARNDKVKVIYNSWCQERVAYRLDKEEFTNELIKRLQFGKHCAAFCGTKAFAGKVYKRVKQALPDCRFCIIHETLRARRSGQRIWLM